MNATAPSYRGYRFPIQIISHAVWLYHRFSLSFRDVEDRLITPALIHAICEFRARTGPFEGLEPCSVAPVRPGREDSSSTWFRSAQASSAIDVDSVPLSTKVRRQLEVPVPRLLSRLQAPRVADPSCPVIRARPRSRNNPAKPTAGEVRTPGK